MRPTRIVPRLALGLLLSLGLNLNATAGSAQTPAAAPAMVIAQPLYAFPNVVDGTEILHDFKVQNQGAGVLEIEKVRTG